MAILNKYILLFLIVVLASSCSGLHWGNDALIPVRQANKYGYIDYKGNSIINHQYDRAGCFSGGLAPVAFEVPTGFMWGYIDVDGRTAIKPNYVYTTAFSDGLAFAVTPGGVPTAIDKNGIPRFRLHGVQGAESFSGSLAAVSILTPEGELWGFVNKSGKIAIQPAYYAVGYFSEGLCSVMDRFGRWGYINKSGTLVIDYQYTNAYPFIDGKAKIVQPTGTGIIGTDGGTLLRPRYQDADPDGEYYLVKHQEKWGWVSPIGNVIIPVQFTDAYPFGKAPYAAVRAGSKWGYIDANGKFVIAPQYDFAFAFHKGVAPVEVAGKYGFIDEEGKYIVSPRYDHIPVDYYIRRLAGATAYNFVRTDTNEPRSIAHKWLSAFYHLDFDEAYRYSTEETSQLLDKFTSIGDMISDSTRRHMNGVIVGIRGVRTDGNRAIVSYALSDNRNKEQQLFLIRQKGKWQVQFSKNDFEEEPQ